MFMKDIGNWRKNKSSWLLVVVLYCIQGCHWSGNSRGKKFFKVRIKSGNFILSQGKLIFWRNVRKNWRVHVERTAISSRKKPRCAVCIFQGNAIFIGGKSGNFEKWCLWQPWCLLTVFVTLEHLRSWACELTSYSNTFKMFQELRI